MNLTQTTRRSFFSKPISIVAICSLAFAIGACSSKKKAADADTPAAATDTGDKNPAIDSSAMSFDAAGSDSGKIDGLKTIHFPFDKATLSSESKKQIQGNAEWLKAHATNTLQIEGHCDQKGSTEYNLALGERRAKAVRDYMASLGIDGKRLSIISYGKEKPVAHGDSESDMAKNRRANFLPLTQ